MRDLPSADAFWKLILDPWSAESVERRLKNTDAYYSLEALKIVGGCLTNPMLSSLESYVFLSLNKLFCMRSANFSL